MKNSNVLQTTFICQTGTAQLIDLMAVSSEEFKKQAPRPDHHIIRQLTCSDGEMEIGIQFRPCTQSRSRPLQIHQMGALGLRLEVGRGAYWLRSNLPLHVGSDQASAIALVKRGDVLQFSLSYTENAPAVLPALGEVLTAEIDRSIRWWQQWSERCPYDGP